jgi:hypothetical protein
VKRCERRSVAGVNRRSHLLICAVSLGSLAWGAPNIYAAGPRAGSRVAPPAMPVPPTPPTPLADLPGIPSLDAEQLEALRELRRLGYDAWSFGEARPRGWFGIGLHCENCSISTDDSTGAPVWRFRSAPEIYSVDRDSPADKAGVKQGDVLQELDGVPITSVQGGRRFGAVKPKDTVRWTLERDGKVRTVTLTAEDHPDFDWDSGDSEEMRDALQKLAREHEKLSSEMLKLESKGDLEAYQRALKDTEREMESVLREFQRAQSKYRSSWTRGWGGWGRAAPIAPQPPQPPQPPQAPAAHGRRHLRYQGSIAGSDVEVRGSGAVAVTEDREAGELVITTPEATIRVRKSK